MQAGAEIGVASTKAFTNMLISFYSLAISLAHKTDKMTKDSFNSCLARLKKLQD